MLSLQNENPNITMGSQKQNKTYNLAIQFSAYEQTPKRNIMSCSTNTYRLPRIADVDDEEGTNRKKSPVKNIFQSQKPQTMKLNQLMNEKSFNIVGKKQVKAYQNKIIKKKNILQRRNQSALSISRYSSSGKSQNQTGIYMNKEDVLGMIKMPNEQQNKNKNQTRSQIQDRQLNSTLRRAKQKLNQYTKLWDGKKIKSKYPSILQQISQYRTKVQAKQLNQLKERKTHIKQNIWIQTLRTPKSVLNYYKNSFITKVQKNGLAIKGKQKLKQQLDWIQKKDKSGYTFAFFQSFNTKIAKQQKQQKRIGLVQSKMKHHKIVR